MKKLLYLPIAIGTAMVGYAIHHSVLWSIADFVFVPLAWAKWLLCQEVNLTVLRSAFAFLLR